jgi:hypothetical protein
MRLNYLDSIGFCKARCQDTDVVVTGRLVYLGAGRYCVQQNIDMSLMGDSYTAFRTDNIFVDITSICEFTKMYAKDDIPVFNNDVIQDQNDNRYYVYWDSVRSAYLYTPLTDGAKVSGLDITTTDVIGNILLDADGPRLDEEGFNIWQD